MKRWIGYIGGFVAVSFLFCICYYASYQNALTDFNKETKEQKESLYSELVRVSEENKSLLLELARKEKEMEELAALPRQTDMVEAGAVPQNTVLPTVSYIEETYNAATGALDTMEKVAPGFLVGMTKEELTAYLTNYMDNLSIIEYEAGLLDYEIVSFSENRVILRKTYDVTKNPYKYYVNISDGMVTVYYSDLKSVFEYTHIPAVDLSEENRIALLEGIYVKDREELYSLLEGFSS